MAQDDTLTTLVREIGRALLPLREAIESVESFQGLMLELGWTVDDVPPPILGLLTPLDALVSAIDALIDGDPIPAEVEAARQATLAVFAAIDNLPTATFDPALAVDDFANRFPPQLIEHLLIRYLLDCHPRIELTLRVLGLVRATHVAASGNRPAHMRRELVWADFTQLAADPFLVFERAYGWCTPQFQSNRVLDQVQDLVVSLGVPAFREAMAKDAARVLENGAPVEGDPIRLRLNIPLFDQPTAAGGEVRGGLALIGLPQHGALLPGLALMPYAEGDLDRRFDITPNLSLILDSGFDLQGGVGVRVRPNEGLEVIVGFNDPASATAATGRLSVHVEFQDPDRDPIVLVGSADGSRIEVKSVSGAGGLHLDATQEPDLFGELELQEGRLVVAPGNGDGFLQQILPADGFAVRFDLAIGLSSQRGLYFRGSSTLEINIPTHLRIGPIALKSVTVAIKPAADALRVSAGAAIEAQLGPLLTTVEDVGLKAEFRFPGSGGNLGPVDLEIGFKPPNGAGLSINEAVVTGGGFLTFKEEEGQYAGVVELNLEGGIAVKGMGLIATRLPNNVKGFSLLIVIQAEDFKPIPLPLGFRLIGIGGLLAINRTFAEDMLRAGLKNHTLDSVLFPKDPIRNAPQILSNLNSVFPPAKDHHLFGPMAQITWGTPPLLTADLGLVLEFGARLRLLILAQVVAILPKPENELIRLQMDAVGVLDFDQGTASLDATLYDSRLLRKFVLTGDMAMRLKWEGSPNFALAIGGLHPAFNPPPAFPKLERIAINLSAGDNPRFRAEAYFALTSNTVQFGARAELYVSVPPFSIQGETGYDVLIQRDPFQFLADFFAQVQLKRGSSNLFKIRVEGALAGPRPLHLKAKATFEVLWWDVSIRIDQTLVEGELPPRPEPIDVLPLLKEALENPGNWMTQLPTGQRPMVTLRGKPGAAGDVLLHPLGTLTVKQSVVPLDMDISLFGPAAPAGARRFTISGVSLNGQTSTAASVRDFFAPAQFFEMSDAEKLSRPSFEPMAAGISIGSDEFIFSTNSGELLEVDAIKFETFIVDKENDESRRSNPDDPYELSRELLGKQARFGSAGTSELRRTGRAKYRTTTIGKHRIEKEGWSIVATDDLTMQSVPGIEADQPTTYSKAAQALQRLKQEDPRKAAGLKILRFRSEVRAVD